MRSPKKKGPAPIRRVDEGQASTVFVQVDVDVPAPERLLTLQQAADAAGLSFHTLRDQVERGVVPSVKIGRARRVRLGHLVDR